MCGGDSIPLGVGGEVGESDDERVSLRSGDAIRQRYDNCFRIEESVRDVVRGVAQFRSVVQRF